MSLEEKIILLSFGLINIMVVRQHEVQLFVPAAATNSDVPPDSNVDTGFHFT